MTEYKELAAILCERGDDDSDAVAGGEAIVALQARIEALEAERDEARELAERLKLEAQGHASEARTANSTIYEIYQALTGGTGEPGNWNGAAPARAHVERCKGLEEALREIAESRYTSDGWVAERARLALQENTNGG